AGAVAESALGEIGRRPEVFARPVAARLELVVGGALVLVAQHLVGLVDRLEALLGAGLLADVRMVPARQPAVGALDLALARRRLDAEGVVVILELHRRPLETRDPRDRRGSRFYAAAPATPREAASSTRVPRTRAVSVTPPGFGAAWFPDASESRSRAR